MLRGFSLFILLLLFSGYAGAALEHGELAVFAITDAGEALTASLSLDIKKGGGRVWTSVEPLVGTSTQTTARIAVDLARNYSSEVDKYDFLFGIASEASLVEGPSAGAAMALLAISMLQDKQIPGDVGITGTITEDGIVGGVGVVFEKAREASKHGLKLFMVPSGETQQIIREDSVLESINLSSYALENWRLKVVEVNTIDEVLKYAFEDIEKIDINKTAREIPDFVPKAITFSPDLWRMQELTSRLVEGASTEVKEAKKALSTTLLNKPGVVGVLLTALSTAESDAKQADILLDQNYLFSAANFAFLSKINASFVKSISEKPSIIEPASTIFELRLLNLKKELEGLKGDLNSFIAVEQVEWHIGAQQRLSWAEQKLQEIEKKRTLADGFGVISEEALLLAIQDLEFAIAWIDVTKEFFLISQQSERKALIDDFFREELDAFLVRAEDGLSAIEEQELEQAKEKVETAKIKKALGWNAAAAFDAVFSLSLSDAALFSKGKNLPELKERLNNGIAELDKKIAESNENFVWAQLYLDHARFFSKSIAYYEEFGQVGKALEAGKNGVSLIFLAENLFEVTSQIKEHYSQLGAENLWKRPITDSGEKQARKETQLEYLIVIALLVFILIVLLGIIVVLARNIAYYKTVSVGNQIDYLQGKKRMLEAELAKERISRKEFEKKSGLLDEKLKELNEQKENFSSAIIKIENLRAMLLSNNTALRRIRVQCAKGIVVKSQFEAEEKELRKKISELKKEIKRQEALIEKGVFVGKKIVPVEKNARVQVIKKKKNNSKPLKKVIKKKNNGR